MQAEQVQAGSLRKGQLPRSQQSDHPSWQIVSDGSVRVRVLLGHVTVLKVPRQPHPYWKKKLEEGQAKGSLLPPHVVG